MASSAYGLYTHIQSNKRRSVALLFGLFLLVYVLVYAGALLGEASSADAPLSVLTARAGSDFLQAMPWASAGTALWILFAYHFHQTLIDMVTGGREAGRTDAPRLYNTLENLCISRGLKMPRLKVMETDALNAFATGLNDKQYSVTVTTGLLEALSDDEIEAVLAHELTHIRNGDVRLLVFAVVIAGVVSFFGELLFRLLANGVRFGGGRRESGRRRDGGGGGGGLAVLIALALIALSWALSVVIRFALSRSREYLADAGSVELTKNPDAMIRALRKIEGRGELTNAPSAVMEMCVDNPREGFSDLFATHPSIEKRIAALIQYAGGRDPGVLQSLGQERDAPLLPPADPPAPDSAHQPGPWDQDTSAPGAGTAGPWGAKGRDA